MQSVVITGASTGIGWATAKLLLGRGFRVFGSVRKQADAISLKTEFGANFTPLLFDGTDEAKVLAAAREVREALGGETLTGLVNNAGIAVAGPVLELAADEFRLYRVRNPVRRRRRIEHQRDKRKRHNAEGCGDSRGPLPLRAILLLVQSVKRSRHRSLRRET